MISVNRHTLSLPFLPFLLLIYWAWASLTSRILSSLHALNEIGFSISFLLLIAFLILFFKKFHITSSQFKIRYKRYLTGLPGLYAILLLLILVGSIWSGSPKQGDFLEYRSARMLHWLMQEAIHFIPNWEPRVNYSGTGQEIALLPTMGIFKTDVFVMPVNFLMFATLPGILFQILRLFKVRRRISRSLMWILPPSMSVLVTQAGGSGNDLESVWFCLLTLLLSLQFIRSTKMNILPLLACSAAIFSNIKTSNAIYLPFLALPLLMVLFRTRRSINWKMLALSLLLFVPLSVIPLMMQNYQYLGSVTGSTAHENPISHAPTLKEKLFSNAIGIMRGGLQPALLPGPLHAQLSQRLNNLPGIRKGLESLYGIPALEHEGFARMLLLETEENSGLGIAFTFLILAFVAGALIHFFQKDKNIPPIKNYWAWFYLISSACCILIISSMFAPVGVTRIQAPFFFTIFLMTGAICSFFWNKRFIQKIIPSIGVLILLNSWLIALLVPTHPALPLPLFVKGVKYFSPSMTAKAMETYHKYNCRGRQFQGLLPADTLGPVTFIKSADIPQTANFWHVTDSCQYEWKKSYPVWVNPEQAPKANILILTSDILPKLECSSIHEFANRHSYTIVSSKEVYFYDKEPLQVWALRKTDKNLREKEPETALGPLPLTSLAVSR